MWKIINKNKIDGLPKSPGVYCFKNKRGEFLYIGKAASLRERVKSHFQQLNFKDGLFVPEAEKIGFIETDSEIEALILESKLIKKQQPKYNTVWRDDKKYFYVVISKEAFPRVFLLHRPAQQAIGPFTEGQPIKKTLRFLRRAFPYYTMRIHPRVKCAYCNLGLCPGPNPNKKEYKKDIKKLVSILKNGKGGSLIKSLKKEMEIAARKERFEKAAKIRNQIAALENVFAHARILEPAFGAAALPWDYYQTEKKLRKISNLKKPIARIEGYDISNIQGRQATASMVVFTGGKPDKNSYRKFKMKLQGKPNDVAMIKETLTRRFKHSEWGFPEIILVDGGKPQLNAVIKTKNKELGTKNIFVLALAKKKNELFIEGKKKPILLENQSGELSNLILHIRDEAHRFARKYHIKIRRESYFK
ncbi:MAG: GIY-YIG nuclease family protein [Candidatus Nealsonbacteria bacterium]|nr:GIY-YIG nuclease family protein [Candidatus Nealsonbacteria bacterium]